MCRAGRLISRLGFLALAVVLFGAAGCLFMYERKARVSGDAVVKAKLKAVREGETTRDDILAAFGPPTQTLRLEGGREILTYVLERQDKTGCGILFIGVWESDVQRITRYGFEFRDGVLVRHWKDEVS